MRGVSEVIAIILILMITISLAGLAYMFMSTTMSDMTASAGSTVDTTTTSMMTSLRIESISQDKVYVRNTGQNALTGLIVYVDDQAVSASAPTSIAPREVGTINITSIIFANDIIRVTSSNGVSATKAAPDEWYGAVGYWKFDESSGTTAYDSSPNGNDGTLVNGTAWTTGRYVNGLLFDGVNDYIRVYNSNSLNISSTITYESWVNPGGYGRFQIITSDYASYAPGKGLFSNYSNNVFSYFEVFRNNSGSVTCSSRRCEAKGTTVIQPNTWYHVIGTYDGSSMKLFVNGLLEGQYNVNDTIQTPSSTWGNYYIGNCRGDSFFFNGTIDEVAIWNRSLSAEEITKLYNK